MKIRKKPVEVEAAQWTGLNLSEIQDFARDYVSIEIYDAGYKAGVTSPVAKVTIHTLEGDMIISKGDYIIKDIKGEFYPCKPDIFKMTYERID